MRGAFQYDLVDASYLKNVLRKGCQELVIVLGLRQASKHKLKALASAEHADHTAQGKHLAVGILVKQQLLAASARLHHIYRGEDAPVRQLAVEVQLHVAGALE